LIAIAASPLLTRLFAPEAFGQAALFISIAGVIGVIACLRYDLAVVVEGRDEAAANLLGASFVITLIIALTLVPLGIAADKFYFGDSGRGSPFPHSWLLPVSVLLCGFYNALNGWNTRTKHFTRLAVSRVSSTVTTTSANLGAGFAGYPTGGAMIGAQVTGQAIATTILGAQIWRDDAFFLRSSLSWRGMLQGVKTHKKFALIDSWAGILNSISSQLPIFLLTVFFSPSIVGFYAFGQRLLTLPMGLLGSAIGQAFFQRASVSKGEGILPNLMLGTLHRLFLIGFFPFSTLTLIAPQMFGIVFGDRWVTAGFYVQVLTPWVFFQFLHSPISFLYLVLEKQEINVFFNISLAATRFISILVGGLRGDVMLALLLFSVSGTVVYGLFTCYLITLSGADLTKVIASFRRNAGIAGIYLLPVLLTRMHYGVASLNVIWVSGLAAVLYAANLALLHKRTQRV
jgi:O-antigen/teichoic acid export membrane protein